MGRRSLWVATRLREGVALAYDAPDGPPRPPYHVPARSRAPTCALAPVFLRHPFMSDRTVHAFSHANSCGLCAIRTPTNGRRAPRRRVTAVAFQLQWLAVLEKICGASWGASACKEMHSSWAKLLLRHRRPQLGRFLRVVCVGWRCWRACSFPKRELHWSL